LPDNLPDNKYLYNRKELQMDFDFDWYDYGARFYDPALGRWTTIDPLCEDGGQESVTPYGYVFNNPIKQNDPNPHKKRNLKRKIKGSR
jgi:RHS repeat-associated protein